MFYLDNSEKEYFRENIHLSVKRWKTLGYDCIRHLDIITLEIEMEISLMS